jgi:hypothetical protein
MPSAIRTAASRRAAPTRTTGGPVRQAPPAAPKSAPPATPSANQRPGGPRRRRAGARIGGGDPGSSRGCGGQRQRAGGGAAPRRRRERPGQRGRAEPRAVARDAGAEAGRGLLDATERAEDGAGGEDAEHALHGGSAPAGSAGASADPHRIRTPPSPLPYLGGVPVRAGDPIPAVEVVDASGDRVALGAFGGEHTLLIFLRHLA